MYDVLVKTTCFSYSTLLSEFFSPSLGSCLVPNVSNLFFIANTVDACIVANAIILVKCVERFCYKPLVLERIKPLLYFDFIQCWNRLLKFILTCLNAGN